MHREAESMLEAIGVSPQKVKEVAMHISINHHLADYSGTDPLEVFENMTEENVVVWRPFEDYPFSDVTEFIYDLADSIEWNIIKLLGDK